MVTVYFGYDKEAVIDPDAYFRNVFEPEWLDDDLVKQMVRDIDKSEIISPYTIMSPIFGQIPPDMLSGGVKTIILLLKEEGFYPDLICCGENCQEWLNKVFKMKDVKVSMSGYDLPFKGIDIEAICENDNSKIHGWEEWLMKMLDMAGDEKYDR